MIFSVAKARKSARVRTEAGDGSSPNRTERVRFISPLSRPPLCSAKRAINFLFLLAYSRRRSAEVVLCERAALTCDWRSASERSGSLAPEGGLLVAKVLSPKGDSVDTKLLSGGALCTSSGRSAGCAPTLIALNQAAAPAWMACLPWRLQD